MAMPAFWYEATSDTRDMASRERALASHTTVLGLSVLLMALIAATLLIALR